VEWRLLGIAVPRVSMVTYFRPKVFVTTVLALLWLAALGYGMQVLFKYETTPGSSGPLVSKWPAASSISRQPNKPILVMVAHPRCPCTRASIAELAEVIAHAPSGVNATVLFVKPSGAGADWDDTDLRRSVAAIPGVTVLTDANGIEAALFGAETSGHTLVFDGDGTLVFSGGITATRGHVGSNAGENAVLATLRRQVPDRGRTAVFGCSLMKRDPGAEEKP
jgi:hypothetical protein